ncbi:hypothetical protein [Shewanella waksmanii]|uniref:hypothetical protein n=1 Tax=Shewanella waksmanii TaxID=213783 RepID=UPI0037363FB4
MVRALRRGLQALSHQSGKLGRLLLILALTLQSVVAMADGCGSDEHAAKPTSELSLDVGCSSVQPDVSSHSCESSQIDDCHDCNSQCCACCVNLVQTVQLQLLPQITPDTEPLSLAFSYTNSPFYSLLRPPQA